MKFSFLLCCSILCTLSQALAQTGNNGGLQVTPGVSFVRPGITFDKTEHDFGKINEEGGGVKAEFKFMNTGSTPLVIKDVKPSCGCTTPGWTRDTVWPGKTGIITAGFNPHNRPNKFEKYLTVTTNLLNTSSITLTIRGFVIPKPRSIADTLYTRSGSLRMVSKYLNLGDITTKEPVTQEFRLYNESTSPIKFEPPANLPAYLKITVPPMILPGQNAYLKLTYDAKARKDWGNVTDLFDLYTNDTAESKKSFFVSASIKEYFPPMTREDSLLAPKLFVKPLFHDFGTIKAGTVVSHDFVLENIGKRPLQILKTNASCGCTVGQPEKTLLQPGETTVLKVTFNSSGKKGQENKNVYLHVNDPGKSMHTVTIAANVITE